MRSDKEHKKAIASLKRALVKMRDAGLGVYFFDGNIQICPQPEGEKDPRWDNDASGVCVEIGYDLFVPHLMFDGGVGRGR